MSNRVLVPLLLLPLLACSDSGQQPAAQPQAKPVVYTVNYPLQYFAQRVGGDLVEVRFPAPAGEDPAYWEPDTATLQQYQQADLILLNGAGYAKWVARATLPDSRMVDTSAAFRDRLIEIKNLVTHSHGPEGKHTHGGTAFTTWLDPSLAIAQARAVAEAFTKLLPAETAVIEQNLAALRKDLESIDTALKQAIGHRNDTPLLGSHPVYQYLARAYNLNLKPVHWEPDEMPPAAEWRKLDTLLREHKAQWMIWEAPPSVGITNELEKRGVRITIFYTLGNTPDAGDYLSVMLENAERLRPVYR